MVQQSNSGTNDIFVASNQSARVFAIANNGDVNIIGNGNYKKNNRDIIQDTSNYVLSTSNILVARINSSTFWTANTVDATKIYYNGGNVGIGTTNPTNILQVGGAGRLRIANNNTDFTMIGSSDVDGSTNTTIVLSGTDRGSYNGQIDYVARSTGSHIFYTTASATERMRISSGGNVGIGSNDPSYAKLYIVNSSTALNHLQGTIGLWVHNPTNTAAQNSVICNKIGGSAAGKVIYSWDVSSAWGCSIVINGNDTTNKLLRFNDLWDGSGNDRMVINNANGNVGIGTNNPRARLDLTTPDNNVTATSLFDFRNINDYGIYATSIGITSRGNTLDFLARDFNSSAGIATRNILSLRPEGNVGIGITNPQRQLHVQQALRIGGSGAVIDFGDDLTTQIYRSGTSQEIRFVTGNVDNRMIISSGGNVSIGTTETATYKLNVSGSLNVTSLFVGGTAFTGSSQWVGTSYIYYNGGNVGIGTTNPRAKLDITTPINTATATNLLDFTDINNYGISATSITISNRGNTLDFLAKDYNSGGAIQTRNVLTLRPEGNVGIGTNNPGQKLHVDGVIKITANSTPTNDQLGVYIWNQENVGPTIAGNSFEVRTGGDNPRMRINTAGNVGIGTITIQSSYKLQVQGNTWVENQLVFNNSYIGGGADYACNKIMLYGGVNTPTINTNGVYGFGVRLALEYYSNNGHIFYTETKGGTTYGTERMKIDITGAVSIPGTLSAGATTITGNSAVIGTLEVGAATAELLISGNSIVAQGSDANIPLTLQTKGTSSFAINTGATPAARLTITDAGAVSIPGTLSAGVTTITGNSAVIGTLEVGAATAELLISGNSIATAGTDANIPLTLQTKGTSSFAINTGATPTSRLTITNAGNVGIGVTNPSYKMHLCNTAVVATGITGTTSMPLRISAGDYSDTGNGTATLIGLATQETAGTVWTKCAIGHCRTAQFDVGSIVFLCNNSATSTSVTMSDERMRITNVGNVGIGTNNPQQKLDIQGTNPTIRLLDTNTDGNAIIQFRELSDLYGMDIAYIGNLDNKMYIRAYNNSATAVNHITINRTDGNIGIGNTAPIGPLCIGNASVASSDGFLVLGKRDAGTTSRQFRIGISDTTFEFVIGNYGVNNVAAATWVQQFKMANNAPMNSLIVDATGGLSVFGRITSYYSDERLKTKTANISNPLKIIDKLNGFYYIPNELAYSFGITNNKQDIGLSAQEVQKVLPELVNLAPFDLEKDKDGNKVSKSGENYLTLAYDRLAPIFVEAIKELNQKNISLTKENNKLKDKYNNNAIAINNTAIKIDEYGTIIKSQEERIKDLETKMTHILNNMSL
jgi:hypothetical protein